LVSIVGHAIFQTAGCSGPSTIDRSYLGLSMTVAKTYKHTDPLKEDQTHGEDIGDTFAATDLTPSPQACAG
jgi:hypothetical protein